MANREAGRTGVGGAAGTRERLVENVKGKDRDWILLSMIRELY